MSQVSTLLLPFARKSGIVVRELADEVMVYDLERHTAHCLNPTAVAVWKRCDGQASASDVASALEQEWGTPVPASLVLLAARQLDQAHLFETALPADVTESGISRRSLLRAAGIAAAIAIPTVTSLVALTAAQAHSCAARERSCIENSNCCAGLTCQFQFGALGCY